MYFSFLEPFFFPLTNVDTSEQVHWVTIGSELTFAKTQKPKSPPGTMPVAINTYCYYAIEVQH